MDPSAIESIHRLKYRYFRFLDTKRFVELGELLTDDATTSYQGGELSQPGATPSWRSSSSPSAALTSSPCTTGTIPRSS